MTANPPVASTHIGEEAKRRNGGERRSDAEEGTAQDTSALTKQGRRGGVGRMFTADRMGVIVIEIFTS